MTSLVLWLLLFQSESPPGEPPADRAGAPIAAESVEIKGADLSLLTSVREIAQRVEQQREQKFRSPPIAVRTPDHMREVAATIRALNVLERERLEARGRAWEDLGLGQPSSPERLYLLLAGDLAGIGFDPQGNRLLVAPEVLTDKDFSPQGPDDESSATLLMMTGVRVDEPLASHLLMHVRQRERRGADSLAETTDELLASSAWAEGEANLVAIRYLFAGMGLADAVLDPALSPADLLDGALVPPALANGGLGDSERALVRFVYDEGFFAAKTAFGAGGWEALDRAMAARTTTRDLIHPGREAAAPVRVVVERPPQADGLERVDTDTLGQQAIVTLVSTVTGKDNLGLQAGDGWVGDSVVRWEDPQHEPRDGVTVWCTRLRDAQAAADFDYAVSRTLQARFPGRPPIEIDGDRVIQTADRVVRLRRVGVDVTLQVSARRFDELPAGGSRAER
ncbi:MAG TPA: hypothetical protein VD788_16595 [Candidatus Polarisedimenticolaceae bacterium]|nr:hypothetical protein [Candidatus Polarisedimenticolaceae bacterium]